MRRTAEAAAQGAVLGGAAGLLLALADYGAHWLWLESWPDRGVLLLRLLGLIVPASVALGGLAFGLIGASEGLVQRLARGGGRQAGHGETTWARRERLLRALRDALIAAPGLYAVGRLLFTGGSMSRLSARAWLEPLVIALLVAGALVAAYAARAILGWAGVARARGVRVGAAALALGFGLGKLNQWALPKLYDYLHAALCVASFVAFACGLWLLVRGLRQGVAMRTWVGTGAVLALGSAALLPFTILELDQNQNVRVALMHPNAPGARSLMLALGPTVLEPMQRKRTAEARALARRTRSARSARPAVVNGPVIEDAHVLLITIDALRPDHLGFHGYARPTSPNLDQLAARSMVFERAYAQAPHSSYSLCSLMTSEYLHETLDLGLPSPEATLATAFAQAGYHTAAFYTEGIFHTEAERLRGYERSAFGFALHDQVAYRAEQLTERVLAEVDRTVARGEPSTLLWAHFFDVHEPYLSTHFGKRDVDRYDSEIRHVDGEVERLVREVRRRLKRPVIVALSADHGEEFREHGGVYHGSSLYEEQVRVPLLFNAEGLAARRIATPVESIDVAPTLLGLAGLPVPESMRGRDLRAHMVEPAPAAEPVFSAVIHKKMVVRWPYKLVADLRFGLFELYDLARDPRERDNLADREPERVAALRDDVYGWLDALAPQPARARDELEVALERGRLRDRRAVEPLAKLVEDAGADALKRMEAARLLGILADERAAPGLARATEDLSAPGVAAEAAIALGRMYDPRARDALRELVSAEDPDLRVRAAVSLGRLRDAHAVPALIEALWMAQGDYERQEAVRWLGRIRDPRAIEPLIHLLPQQRTRFLVVTALGSIGDPRALEPLCDVLAWDRHPDVRAGAVRGLGLLGDPRALDPLLRVAQQDGTIELAAESLIRLGALERGMIGGLDVTRQSTNPAELGDCYEGPLLHDWDYEHRTHCTTRTQTVSLTLAVPESVATCAFGPLVIVSARRTDAREPAELVLRIGDAALPAVTVDGNWVEHRFALDPETLPVGRVTAELEATAGARFALDHVLILPRSTSVLAARTD